MDRHWRIAALAAVVIFIYGQTGSFQFINYDDDGYVTANAFVLQGLAPESIAWAFSSLSRFYWHPATWLSLMADVQLFGVSSRAMHIVNAGLHLSTAILVFLFLRKLTGHEGRSFTVALLFAAHPLRVESVAWVAERKDVLCGALMAGALLAYAHYVGKPSRRRYLTVLGLFVLACMAKPMAVIIPILLLLIDFWPLGRQALLEKAPFFGVAGVIAVLTYIGQREMGALEMIQEAPFATRLQNAFLSLGEYLRQTVLPTGFSIVYPYLKSMQGWHWAALVVSAVSSIAVWQRQARPWILTGWLWFLAGLAPTLGLIQAGVQSRADRFTYIPHIGLLIVFVWASAELLPIRARQSTAVVAIFILTFLSYAQASVWRDSESVFGQAIRNTTDNWLAEHKYGLALFERKELAGAEKHLRRAVELDPRDPHSRYHLGRLLAETKRPAEAEHLFAETVRLKPDYADAHFAWASMLASTGKRNEAILEFSRAQELGLAPEWQFQAHTAAGVLLAQSGRISEAEKHFRSAVALQPGSAEARQNLAQAEQILRQASPIPRP